VSLRPDSISGYLRVEWLGWSDIVRFELGNPVGRLPSRRVVARTISGETVVICQIPTWLLDSPTRLDWAMDRMLELLEEERSARLSPGA
jgi:hypothetical protein